MKLSGREIRGMVGSVDDSIIAIVEESINDQCLIDI